MDPSLPRRGGMRLATAALAAAWGLSCLASAFQPAQAAPDADSLTVTITPRDVWPPSAVTDLAASPGGEGQLLLQWTAPDSNSDLFALKIPASTYTIRITTYSADSFGSTTTWWNSAQDVAEEPTPAEPGTLQTLLLNFLEPGATYYAAIKSVDQVGNVSPMDVKTATPGQQAMALVFDAVPPAPLSLATTSVAGVSVSLAWSTAPAYDLDFFRLYVDSSAPYDFADAFLIAVDSPALAFTHSGLIPGATYAYRLTAVDKGAPPFAGVALESPASNIVVVRLPISIKRPMAPSGLRINAGGSGVNLSWLPTRAYEDGTPFAVPSAPAAVELTGYQLSRATAAVLAPWATLAAVSTGTLSWTDGSGGPDSYYYVEAENSAGLSEPCMIRAASGPGYIVAPDKRSFLQLSSATADALAGDGYDMNSAYLVRSSSPAAEPDGRALTSVDFQALKGGGVGASEQERAAATIVELADMAKLRLHRPDGGAGSAGLGSPAAAPQPAAENLSVYWHNGSKWLQLFGKQDALGGDMLLEVKYLGRYQLRSVERLGGFAIDAAGLTNRLITPNGDGKNDAFVIIFDNPRDSAVGGRILDLQGAAVADMAPGPAANSLMWDGRAGGRPVSGGVYIYQVEAEGKLYTGTVVVVK